MSNHPLTMWLVRWVGRCTGLVDLLPWLKQWHNEFNAEIGMAFGGYIVGFLDEEARKQGTVEALWKERIGG